MVGEHGLPDAHGVDGTAAQIEVFNFARAVAAVAVGGVAWVRCGRQEAGGRRQEAGGGRRRKEVVMCVKEAMAEAALALALWEYSDMAAVIMI